MTRGGLTWIAAAGLTACLSMLMHPLSAQQSLETLPVQGQVYVLAGPGGNTVVQTGADGALIVDPAASVPAATVLSSVRALTPRDLRYLVLTGFSAPQAGAVAQLAKAGRNVRLLDSNDPRGGDARASIIAHVNVLNRMSAAGTAADSWPTDTYFTKEWSIFSNGEAVQFLHVANAVTDGDTLVFFRRSDVICAGAIFDATNYPRFDPRAGGGINGVIEGLNQILDIAIAGENQEGGTEVVPGRGRLSDETDVANYRDMVTIIRDRVLDMVKKGMTIEQVKRARLTADYDGLYDQSGDWDGERFVEALFADLGRSAR
jgi:glyoxylase-like metal-dependent hydrolase (beta-lactamase superfamily II)